MHAPGANQLRSTPRTLSFDDTETAFRGKPDSALRRAYWLFKAISLPLLTKAGAPLARFALYAGLPIKSLIKSTIFAHFCGGENIEECERTITQLHQGGVGSILDYSVEGEDDEVAFDQTCEEICRTVKKAEGDSRIPLTVFKVTGLGRSSLLEKKDGGDTLTEAETLEFNKIEERVDRICGLAFQLDVRVMIDAEESWIQDSIDALALEMMRRYNKSRPLVYNTYQMYRSDKLQSLRNDIQTARNEGFFMAAKLVRGAYMEKERDRAAEQGYPSPINPTKEATDAEYDAALQLCVREIDRVAIVAGTHNENSSGLLAELLDDLSIPHNHDHVYFSQLLGMSDNLSFNLAAAGYRVAKYVPYGPVKAVLPYLIRRAEENTAVAGQMGRELSLIVRERRRRRAT